MTGFPQARRTAGTLLLAGFFILPSACRRAPSESASTPGAPSAPRAPGARPSAPDFTLKDTEGRTVALSSLKGEVVFLEFWATWCYPCRISMPAVEKLYEEFSPKGLRVLGMNVDEDPSVVPPFLSQLGVKYPTLLVGNSGADRAYQVSGIPAFFLIDKHGRAVNSWVGFDGSFPAQWGAEVERLLQES